MVGSSWSWEGTPSYHHLQPPLTHALQALNPMIGSWTASPPPHVGAWHIPHWPPCHHSHRQPFKNVVIIESKNLGHFFGFVSIYAFIHGKNEKKKKKVNALFLYQLKTTFLNF